MSVMLVYVLLPLSPLLFTALHTTLVTTLVSMAANDGGQTELFPTIIRANLELAVLGFHDVGYCSTHFSVVNKGINKGHICGCY